MNAAYPLSSEIVMLIWMSSVRARICAITQPTASPIAIPPAAPARNWPPALSIEKLEPITAPTAIL